MSSDEDEVGAVIDIQEGDDDYVPEQDEVATPDTSSFNTPKRKDLQSILYDDKVEIYNNDTDGRQRWRCLWCNKTFHWNPTKALCHLARVGKSDIAICTGKIDETHAANYLKLYNARNKKKDNAVAVQKVIEDSITKHNNNSASVLEGKRKRTSSSATRYGRETGSLSSTLTTIISVDGHSSSGKTKRLKMNSPPVRKNDPKKYLQLLVHDGTNASVESKLTMAIADMIHSCGLPFSFASNLKFRRVLGLSRRVPLTYKPPGRNQVATELLDINYDSLMSANRSKLIEDIDVFGLTFYGDGATVRKMPLINILASGGHLHTAVMEIVDATEQMQSAGKKDARYLASLFRPHIDYFEKTYPNSVDYCTMDGAGSVQKAAHVLNARYPRIFVTHGAEHVISLFFQDCFKLPIVNTLHKIERKAYKLFGSGAQHAPYAIFQKYCKLINNGKSIGLIRPAGNRMAGAAIALMRAYRLKNAFINTLNSHEFISLKVRQKKASYSFLLNHI
jgi:hypothetical protein